MRVTEHAMKRLFTKQELEQIEDEAKFKLLTYDENQKKVIIVDKPTQIAEDLEPDKSLVDNTIAELVTQTAGLTKN